MNGHFSSMKTLVVITSPPHSYKKGENMVPLSSSLPLWDQLLLGAPALQLEEIIDEVTSNAESCPRADSNVVERSVRLEREVTMPPLPSLLSGSPSSLLMRPRSYSIVVGSKEDRDLALLCGGMSEMGELALDEVGFKSYPAPKKGYRIVLKEDGLYYQVAKTKEPVLKKCRV